MMGHAQEESVDSKIGGVPITIKGLNMVVFLALVAVTSFTIYYLSIVLSREHLAIADRIDAQTKITEQQTEAIREQNYILLADEKETERIRRAYRIPPSLRAKLEP